MLWQIIWPLFATLVNHFLEPMTEEPLFVFPFGKRKGINSFLLPLIAIIVRHGIFVEDHKATSELLLKNKNSIAKYSQIFF